MRKKTKFDEIVSVTVLTAMLCITFANVVSRYLLHMSISYTEELVSMFFVLLSTMGGAIAAREGSHFTLDLVTAMLSKKWQNKLYLLNCGLSILAAGVLTVTGVQMVMQQHKIGGLSYALKVPEWIYGLFVPLGCAFMACRFLQSAMKKSQKEVEE